MLLFFQATLTELLNKLHAFSIQIKTTEQKHDYNKN